MPSVRLELPADVRFVRVATACAAEVLAAHAPRDGGVEHDVLLALQEACMNVIDHAYRARPDGRFSLELTVGDEAFVAELCDDGAPFDPSVVPEPDLCNGQVRGYGLFLMRALLDDLSYSTVDGTNRLRMVKRFA